MYVKLVSPDWKKPKRKKEILLLLPCSRFFSLIPLLDTSESRVDKRVKRAVNEESF